MLDEMREFQEENDANFPGEEETSSADDPERSAKNLRSLVASSPTATRCASSLVGVGDDVRVAAEAPPVEPLSISDERTAAAPLGTSDDAVAVGCEACGHLRRSVALRGGSTRRDSIAKIGTRARSGRARQRRDHALATRETSPGARRVADRRRHRWLATTRTRGAPSRFACRRRSRRRGSEADRRAAPREGRRLDLFRRARRSRPRRENHRRVATRTTVSPRRWNETTRRTRRHRRKPLSAIASSSLGGRRGRRSGRAAIGSARQLPFSRRGGERARRADEARALHATSRIEIAAERRRSAARYDGGTRGRERRRAPREGWPPSTRTPRRGWTLRRGTGRDPRRPTRRRGNKQTERRTESTWTVGPHRIARCGSSAAKRGRRRWRRIAVSKVERAPKASTPGDARGTRWPVDLAASRRFGSRTRRDGAAGRRRGPKRRE